MVDGWEWDRTLFEGSAAYYERGRLPYAAGYAERLAAALGPAGSGRLLDVGCGPGIVALAMAPAFGEVVGLDPDPDMLAEAARQAALRGVANARWVEGRAEDLPAGLGEFQAVVFAQSFHWTDRERVAATVLEMLEPGGALVLVGDLKDAPAEPPPPSAPPYPLIQELVRGYLGPVRRAGQGRLLAGTPSGEARIIESAGFGPVERLIVPDGRLVTRDTDDVVAWVFSRSDSAPHLFGPRLARFEHDLRSLLRRASPEGFAEHLPATELRIWRKPAP